MRASKVVAALGIRLLIDENIFAVGSINNSCHKHLFYYLQSSEDNSQQSKSLKHLFYNFQLVEDTSQ